MTSLPYKNILVTGGCGFIGSNFLNYMVPLYPYINFYNIDCLNYCSDINNIDQSVKYHHNYKFFHRKLQDKEFLLTIFHNFNIDCIVHFAAQSHVDNSFSNALLFTDDNILSTHILLECCRLKPQIKKFIHISTDEVYGDSTLGTDLNHCKTENSILNPTNPYAATKAASEMLSTSYFHSFNIPVIITRCNNVYGPCQYEEKLIPKFIHHLINNQHCTMHGDGQYLRSFLHTFDLCSAIQLLLSKGSVGEIYNIGSDDEFTVNQIADLLVSFLKPNDYPSNWKKYGYTRVYNDTRYLISSDKIKSLGWTQTIDFKTGILDTIKWYVDKFSRTAS